MSRSIARRLRDAASAFATGHSVRDLDRVKRRRLILLCERAIASDQRRIDADEFGILKAGLPPLLDAFRRDLHRFVERKERGADRILAQRLDLLRSSLHSSRLHDLASRKAGGDIAYAAYYYVEALSIPPAKTYGKLYEGLLDKRLRYERFGKPRFQRCDWHSLSLRWKVVWTLLARGKLPVRLLQKSSYHVEPRFRNVLKDQADA